MSIIKQWSGRVLFFAGLLLLFPGCFKSDLEKDFERNVELTKSQYKASEVKAAALPLFVLSENTNKIVLPTEITSLPIFGADTNDIQMLSLQTTNVFMFITGGGFGHWGIIVSRFNDEREISQWHRNRMTPWNDGVFFFRE